MELQQIFDSLVSPVELKFQRDLSATNDNLKQFDIPESLEEINGFKESIELIFNTVTSGHEAPTLELVQKYLSIKSLEEEDLRLSKIQEKIELLDNQVTSVIETENLRRQLILKDAEERFNAEQEPFKIFNRVRQSLISTGYLDEIRGLGFDISENEVLDVSDIPVEQATEFLQNVIVKETSGILKYIPKDPYEFCVQNPKFSISVFLIFVLIGLTSYFNIFGIIGILAIITNSVLNAIKYNSIIKVYSILVGYDTSEYLSEFVPPEGCQPMTTEEINTFPNLVDFESQYDMLNAEFNKDVENEYGEMLVMLDIHKSEYQAQIDGYEKAINDTLAELTRTYTDLIERLEAKAEEIRNSFVPIGRRRTEKADYKNNFVLGNIDVNDEWVEADGTNICMSTRMTEEDRNAFAQLYIANLFSNVALGLFTVHVYDPYNMGRSIMPIYNTDMNSIILFQHDNFNSIMNEVQEAYSSVLSVSGGQPIGVYNKECQKLERLPQAYHFVFILSDSEAFTKNEAFINFASKSAEGGIYFLLYCDKPPKHALQNFKAVDYTLVEHPLKLSTQQCNEYAGAYAYDFKNNNTPKGLEWSKFIDNLCPVDKFWKSYTDDEARIYPGYTNGDPTRADSFGLGNTGNVHGIVAGATGSGKSVFLNQMILTLTTMYSPAELELWLCDFKGSEFGKFLSVKGSEYIIPHIKACLCTADGDFAASLFDALEAEGKRRYNILQKPELHLDELRYFPEGEPIPPFQDGSKDWNKYWRKRAATTGNNLYLRNCMPRTIVIVDEFQNIFQEAEDESKEVLIHAVTYLAKVARAANMNMLLSSQTLTGTLPQDLFSQMTFRVALRCDKDLSTTLLGTDKAANIRYKYGYLVATGTGVSPENQPIMKTPYLMGYEDENNVGDIASSVNKMHESLSSIPYFEEHRVISYIEKDTYPIEELYKVFDDNIDKLPDSGIIFSGMPMAYTPNKVPNNFVLTAKNNTHIISVFSEISDIVLWSKQLFACFSKYTRNHIVIANSQVQDIAYVTELEDYIDEDVKWLISKSVSCEQMISIMEQAYEARKDRPTDDCDPAYFVLYAWDKGIGFGVDTDYDLRKRMVNYLQIAGEKNIHVIFINQSMSGISDSITNSCKYRLAGHCTQDDSMSILGKKHASKTFDSFQKGWVYSMIDGKLTKSKLYISPINREIAEDSITIV